LQKFSPQLGLFIFEISTYKEWRLAHTKEYWFLNEREDKGGINRATLEAFGIIGALW
jgi:hypothetical protein